MSEDDCKHYSGKGSVLFWDRVGRLPDAPRRELYSCGVLLQDMEIKVLKWLANAETRAAEANPESETSDAD